MSKDIPVKMVRPEFLDFVNYNICKAYSEKYGREAAAEFFRRVGEIGFQELRKMVEFPSSDPYEVLRTVGKFLEDMGYMSKIRLTKVEENEVIIEMFGVSVIKSSIRLVEGGDSPSHFMTNLMFAALKEMSGVRADIYDLTLEQPSAETGYAKEKWVLKKI
ncbi:hypothetical protein DRO42_07495 [Candidatus Bathyarchaeota archaeon]|nr:MAG: hypothetical protein DRO42_07495 [Candidatus Bathyarchaeota archaeon]